MKSPQKGFSLVEVMVAMVIGMVSMIVVMQVFFLSESRKRTTTGGADAQANAALAYYMLERDIKMAGWGIDSAAYSGCANVFTYCDGNAVCGGTMGALNDFRFASLRIIDGGAKPDILRAQYFANPNLDTYRFPARTNLTATMPLSSSEMNVASVSGCATGDMALVSAAGNCTLMQVTEVQGPALKMQHTAGTNAPFNPSVNYQKDNNWPAYTRNASVSCFKRPAAGPMFQRVYSINAQGQMQRSDNTVTPAIDEVVAPEIVDLQAEYGIAVAGTQAVTQWVSADASEWIDPSLTNWKRIKAVRIALVARSSTYERPAAGQACTTTTDAMAKKWSDWHTFNTSGYPADWRCYRYKVLESVVPLRNVIWGKL